MLEIYKKRGELLSELLTRARREQNIENSTPITYAGRLDPMAEGLVLLLVGDETKEKENYLGLPKVYEFEVLFGVSTDTHDVLGVIDGTSLKTIERKDVESASKSFEGKFIQTYPIYSSKTINGKPLFMYAREGVPVDLPGHEVSMEYIEFINFEKKKGGEIKQIAVSDISKVSGDFRQDEAKKSWEKFGIENTEEDFYIARFKAKVGSGFYIRVFAQDLGGKLGIHSLAWSIKRQSIGENPIFSLEK